MGSRWMVRSSPGAMDMPPVPFSSATCPTRIFGPPRSPSTATGRPCRRAASRIWSRILRWPSRSPWEKLSRQTSTPSSKRATSRSTPAQAGPIVATILVWIMTSTGRGAVARTSFSMAGWNAQRVAPGPVDRYTGGHMRRRPGQWLSTVWAAAVLLACATAGAGEPTAAERDAAEALRLSAEGGNAAAMVDLGDRYRAGNGVKKDYTQAMSWYRRAADAGVPAAMTRIGHLYAHAHGVPLDFEQAMTWYRKAADLKDPLAMNNIGYLYQHAQGVEANYEEAMKWYRAAADANDTHAMCNIGY